jgi:anti-sigma B factor antagonist
VRLVGEVAILDLSGRLVLGDGEQVFREKVDELVRSDHKNILVNFRNVTYLDSAGIGAVVWKYVSLKKQGGALKLLHLQPRSHNVLSITKLLTVLDSFESEEEAMRSFGAP